MPSALQIFKYPLKFSPVILIWIPHTLSERDPDEDDWGKLKRVIKYLKGTRHMKLTLTVDNMNTVSWWVDASYGVHMDCKGHTGMMISLGKGAAMSFLRSHKFVAGRTNRNQNCRRLLRGGQWVA